MGFLEIRLSKEEDKDYEIFTIQHAFSATGEEKKRWKKETVKAPKPYINQPWLDEWGEQRKNIEEHLLMQGNRNFLIHKDDGLGDCVFLERALCEQLKKDGFIDLNPAYVAIRRILDEAMTGVLDKAEIMRTGYSKWDEKLKPSVRHLLARVDKDWKYYKTIEDYSSKRVQKRSGDWLGDVDYI